MNRDNILSCFGIDGKYLSSYDFIEDHELKQITILLHLTTLLSQRQNFKWTKIYQIKLYTLLFYILII